MVEWVEWIVGALLTIWFVVWAVMFRYALKQCEKNERL
jgi:hypothetical protein